MLLSALFYQIVLSLVAILVLYKIVKYFTGFTRSEMPLNLSSSHRQLGFFEKMFDIFSMERSGSGNICIAITIKSKVSLVHRHVRDALILVAKRQPMLRAVITTMSNGDKYFIVKEIDEVIAMFDITSSDIKSSDWQDIWYENTSKQRDDGLLWRVVILKEEFLTDTKDYANTFMFNFNHSCIDGVSCVKFCQQLLARMNEFANGSGCIEEKICSFDLLPYYHNIIISGRIWHLLFNFVLTYSGLQPVLKYFMKKILVRVMEKKPQNAYYAMFPRNIETCPQDGAIIPPVIKEFTQDETKKFVKACRANNCTVTGAITAAIHLSFCYILQNDNSKDFVLDYMFAIDSRRFCDPKPDENYLGVFLYNSDYNLKYLDTKNANFWELARQISQNLKDIVRNEAFVPQMTVLDKALEPRELMDHVFDPNYLDKVMCNYITSFGSFHVDDEEVEQSTVYSLKNCFINTLARDMNFNFGHFVYSINDQMTWQIVIDVAGVDRGHADEFCQLCFGKVIEISSGLV